MTMTIPVAAARIARRIQATEASFDHALNDAAALIGELTAVRQATGVDAGVGQEALMRLSKAQSLLIGAQNEVLRSHGVLRDMARERGDIPAECPTYAAVAQVA